MLPRIIFIVITFCFLQSCIGDHTTSLKVEGGENPTFTFSGGGILGQFIVYDTTDYREDNGRVWEIKPENWEDSSRHVFFLDTIQYGVVPTGYRQVKPANGIPPKLLEGHAYLTMAYTSGSKPGRVAFTIKQGKVVMDMNSGIK